MYTYVIYNLLCFSFFENIFQMYHLLIFKSAFLNIWV